MPARPWTGVVANIVPSGWFEPDSNGEQPSHVVLMPQRYECRPSRLRRQDYADVAYLLVIAGPELAVSVADIGEYCYL